MSNEPSAGTGLDPELLAAYIDQRLTPEQRRRVEAELAADPDSYAVLVETMKAHDALGLEKNVTAPTKRSSVIAASALAAAAVIALAVWMSPALLQMLRGNRVDPRLERLVAAVGDERYSEARFTGGFHYGPLRSATRGTQDLNRANLSLVAAAGELQKDAVANPNASTLHAWGVAQVLLGDHAGGIESLRDALRRDARNTALLADLAAALLARNASGDAAEAYDLLSRIAPAENLGEEASFNRALALERMGLSRQAADAWQAFIDRYPSSAWRQDALSHLQASKPQASLQCESVIAAPPPRLLSPACRAPALKGFQLVHLKRWTDAVRSFDAGEAEQALETLRAWAEVLTRDTGDPLTQDIVRGLRSDRALVGALEEFISAVNQIDSDRLVGAEQSLTRALPGLYAAHHPLAYEAELHLAMVEAQARRLSPAVERLDRIRRATADRGYLSITARELWLRGVVALRDMQPAVALDNYRAAAAIYRQIGFIDPEAAVKNAQADTERLMGLIAQGLGTLQEALVALPYTSQPVRRYLVLFNAALYSELRGLPHASLAYEDQAIIEANAGDTVMAGIEALTYRAKYRAAVHRESTAIEDLEHAQQLLPQVQSDNLRTYLDSRIRLARFDLDAGDGESDEPEVRNAIEYFSRAEPAEVPRLWGTLARSLQKSGNASAALNAVESGIAAFEQSRSRLKHPEFQSSALDAAWELYGQGVDLLMEQGDSPRALRFAQRPSQLQSAVENGAAATVTQMSPGTGMLVFSEVGPRMYWWFLQAGHEDLSGVLPESTDGLATLVADASRSSRRAENSVPPPVLVRLSDVLVGSLDLSQLDRLIVLPDGVLTAFPVPALWNSRANRFLIEDLDVIVGVRIALPSPPHATKQMHALVIANNSADPGVDWLRPLTFSLKEGEAIAATYPNSHLLISDTASKPEIFDAYRAADVIHFAGHAVPNPAVPAMSALVLGGAPVRFLYAYELAQLPESAGKTIVLSACDTASGRSTGGLGANSLARPFLAAGAATVIATTQPLDDRYAAAFFTDFHGRFSRTGDAISALRETQLAAIARHEPLGNWSAVVSSASTAAFLEPLSKE